jgi:GWxTD domain-containing protein
VGFTLDAWSSPDSAGNVLELALRVPPATLEALERDAALDAHLLAAGEVRSRRAGGPQRVTREFTISGADSARGQGKVLVMRFSVAPGPCKVRVRLTDRLSRRKGIHLANADAHEFVEIEGETSVPAPQANRQLSDIEFLWPTTGDEATWAFLHGGRPVVPNPDRLYGLYAADLRARFVASGRTGAEPKPWRWVARVFDAEGRGVAQRESTAAAARTLDADVGFDVSSLAAGAYEIEVKAWQEGDAGGLQRRARFSVGWRTETWLRNAADVADEVHFLLPSNLEDDFAVMPPGEQERVLREFWARRDPTPETAQNEAYDAFRERVAHANAAFPHAPIEKGMFSDMGRVYIRYGPPTEVLHQVIPAGNETLIEQLQEITNREDRVPEEVSPLGPGGDMRPYEVWIYEGDIPLPLDVDPHDTQRGRPHRRLVFLFVDDQGTGNFRLRYSTE